MKNNNDSMEIPKQETTILGGWNPQIKAFPTVEIPLDEYKAFIEFKVKGPTVEIPLEEYNRLKTENARLEDRVFCAESRIRELEQDLGRQQDRQEEIDEHTDLVTKMVADEITEKVMKDLLQLTEEQKQEFRAKWRKM